EVRFPIFSLIIILSFLPLRHKDTNFTFPFVPSRLHGYLSKQEIPLRHWHNIYRLTGYVNPIYLYFIILRIDFDVRGCIITNKILLADIAAVLDGQYHL